MYDEENPSTPNTIITDEVELRIFSSTDTAVDTFAVDATRTSPSSISEWQSTTTDDSTGNASVTSTIVTTEENGSSSVIMANPTTTTTSDNPPSLRRYSSWTSCFYRIFRRFIIIITYPCMIILTAISLVIIIIFCVLPTMICMAIGICIYYCTVEESIPLNLLLRYIFSGDHVDGHGLHGRANSSNNPSSQGQVDRGLSESKLIVRRLLQIEITTSSFSLPVKSDDDNNSFNDNRIKFSTERELENNADDGDLIVRIFPRHHPFPIDIFTENKSLHFSEPLVMKVEEEDDDEKNAEKTISAKKEREIGNNNDEISDDNIHDHNTSNNDDNDHLERRRSQNDSDLQNVVIALDDTIEYIENTLPENYVCCRTGISEGGEARTSDNVASDGCLNLLQECNDNETKNDDDDDDGDGDGGIKDDHKKHHKNDSNETIEEADYSCFDVEGDIRDRGTTCDICILEFEVGDKVAWSPNLDCIHTFHKDCILDWLMRKPTCPNCRLDYLKRKNDEYI
mmetsp:Transcript_31536/g.35311  ORF Transcript_31536/g.35311 Transcript_31536/m.35311 type:complete len:511 (-) Transcript_31536:229-1761(-)